MEGAMNDFDQASRFQVKTYPEAHLNWLFPRTAQVMRWSRRLDSQSAPRPGEPDRRCDTIAELVHREGLTHPRAVVIELFTQSDAEALDRTGEYLWRFRRELRHGPHEKDKYPFVAALLFLTGRCAEREVQADLPDEEDVVNTLKPRILELAEQDAVAFLDAIDHNRLAPALLAWTPLMKGGQTTETTERWASLSQRLGETERRNAASVALGFSELTDSRPVWKPVVEALLMNESILFREIRTEARLATRREDLARVLRTKLSGDELAKAIARVEKQEDLSTLSRWFDLSLTLSPADLVAELDR
jgi:hypothetical protein